MSEKTNIEHFLRLHDQQLHANPCKAPKFSLNVDHDQQHIQVWQIFGTGCAYWPGLYALAGKTENEK